MPEVCQFCGAGPLQIWHDQVISFTCGTLSNDQMPRKTGCWQGLVWKLKERIEVLEERVTVCPEDLSEAVRYTGMYGRAGWWQRLKAVLPEEIDEAKPLTPSSPRTCP